MSEGERKTDRESGLTPFLSLIFGGETGGGGAPVVLGIANSFFFSAALLHRSFPAFRSTMGIIV